MSETQKPQKSITETRRDQIYLALTSAEIERMRRFGEYRHYEPGQAVFRVGQRGHGLLVILSGSIDLVREDEKVGRKIFNSPGAGSIIGELAQLAGRPPLVDGFAREAVCALHLPPERLRALLIAEAELGERIMRALILRRVGILEKGTGGPIIVARGDDGDALRLKGFLSRNGHPYQWMNPEEDADAKALIERFHVDPGQLPIVLCPGGQLLRNPSELELARCIGMVGPIDPERLYDVAIVGAGPAGLAAAVYAASEGLAAIVLDCRAFGGQAGASSRIENYLGFPTGISGMALMARAYNQAQKFGVETSIPAEVKSIEPENGDGSIVLRLSDDQRVSARSVILACGAQYRRLMVEGLDLYEAASVHYWASPLESKLCAGQEVALVGAGNSAGQAAVYLAGKVERVWLLARGDDLASSMSSYLVERIRGLHNVEIVTRAEISGLEGSDGHLQAVRWRRRGSGEEMRRDIRHLFLFIGAAPNTEWLRESGIVLDTKGFVLTGADAGSGRGPLETSRRGVFAIGDVRATSIKRVAAAVGEGAQVVAALHDFLVASDRRNDVDWPFARMAREPGAGLATSLEPVHDRAPSA
ncbi:MAG: FAD-dependent oxidoreductase [Xanthobacteraceae bacterium]|nr:FAD-dependent oxidoreductase [Xanthobacteraceae bacterium]